MNVPITVTPAYVPKRVGELIWLTPNTLITRQPSKLCDLVKKCEDTGTP